MTDPKKDIPLILVNDAALSLPPELSGLVGGGRLVVAGPSRLRLTLAALAMPEATMVWTDFGQSASLAALGAKVRAMGRLDRLVLAGDGADSAQVFAIMQTVIAFLPILKRGHGRGISLVMSKGPALVSLTQFLNRLRPSCDRCGIKLALHLPEEALPAMGHRLAMR